MEIKVIKPVSVNQKTTENSIKIFLAGTIDNNHSFDWQTELEEELKVWDENPNKEVVVFNPRRDFWNSSLKQSIHEPEFNHQVNWELDNILGSDIVFLYFLENSISPISLLELGMLYGIAIEKEVKKKFVVVAPDKFWRKGNVEIVCDRMNIPIYSSYEEGVSVLKKLIMDTR